MCFFKITAYLEIFWLGHKGWPGAGVFRMRAQHCCRNVTGQTLPRVCGRGLHHCRVIEIKSKIRMHQTLQIPKTFPLDLAFIYRASEAVSKPRHGLNPFLPEVSSLQEYTGDGMTGGLIFCSWFLSSRCDSHPARTVRRVSFDPPTLLRPVYSDCLGCLTWLVRLVWWVLFALAPPIWWV